MVADTKSKTKHNMVYYTGTRPPTKYYYRKKVMLRREQHPVDVIVHILRLFARAHPADSPCLVIDPFAGSHSTGVAASRMGCHYLGIDIHDGCKVPR